MRGLQLQTFPGGGLGGTGGGREALLELAPLGTFGQWRGGGAISHSVESAR